MLPSLLIVNPGYDAAVNPLWLSKGILKRVHYVYICLHIYIFSPSSDIQLACSLMLSQLWCLIWWCVLVL